MSTASYVFVTAVIAACGGGNDHEARANAGTAAWPAAKARTEVASTSSARAASALAMDIEAGTSAPSWASSATYYVDPTIGSDANSGLSPEAPRKTLTNSIKMIGVTVLLKRGTTIELRSNLYPRDTFISTYGSASAKPRVVVPVGFMYGIGVDSGQFKISDIVLVGNALTRTGSPGIGAAKASSVTVEFCEIQDYTNGIVFAGVASVIRSNRITRVSNNGINAGSTKGVAPSGSLITENFIDVTGASGDGITLHDGSGVGNNNTISGNRITGANRENGIDIQGQYIDTLIEDNTIEGSGQYSISLDALNPGVVESVGTIVRRNTIRNSTHAAIYARMPNVLITKNVISNIRSTSMAAAVAVEAPTRILDNTVNIPATNLRSIFFVVQKTGAPTYGGEIRGNNVVNYSAQALVEMNAVDRQGMVDLWAIDANSYTATNVTGRWFMGMEFSKWTTGGNGLLKTFKDLSSTLVGL